MEKVTGEALETAAATPARLTVYDAPLMVDSITVQMRDNLDDELTEVKARTQSIVSRRRQILALWSVFRPGRDFLSAWFWMSFVMKISRCWRELPKGSGCLKMMHWWRRSRGSGRVKFGALTLLWRSKDYYAKGAAEVPLVENANLAALQQLATSGDFEEKLS